MLTTLPLKKLVIELRYKARLDFYGKMDSVGLKLSNEYKDWERSALTLDIRQKEKHRRIFMATKRTFFESDSQNDREVIEHATRRLESVGKMLELESIERFGVRQFFVVDLKKSFASTADIFAEKFLVSRGSLDPILGKDVIVDSGITLECKTDDAVSYMVRTGPMEKEQWFRIIQYERGIFASSTESGETFEQYQDSFPESFCFLDIDCFTEDTSFGELESFMTKSTSRTRQMVSNFYDFMRS